MVCPASLLGFSVDSGLSRAPTAQGMAPSSQAVPDIFSRPLLVRLPAHLPAWALLWAAGTLPCGSPWLGSWNSDEIILIMFFKTKWDIWCHSVVFQQRGQMLRMGVMFSLTMSTQTGISLPRVSATWRCPQTVEQNSSLCLVERVRLTTGACVHYFIV